ncbi:hypothetical protein FEM08_18110 [Flavobacterium gilvum]|nr:hypothetical protein FEM08_18110 [Flavobacterium gilvum]
MNEFLLVFLIVLCFHGANAQNKTISGVVSDEKGRPVLGATVKVKGGTSGSITDENGMFRLSVKPGDTVVFTSVGYKSTEAAAADNLQVQMQTLTQELTEVVVTSLGVKKQKRSLGYAVGGLKNEDINKDKVVNLGSALSGRVAGVNVTTPATGVGGSTRVVIRGNTSASGNNQPLYVIDGIPVDNSGFKSPGSSTDMGDGMSSLNPDDIATMSVMKGSSASALYGYRGSNGVILITTKKGTASKGLGVEFSSGVSLDMVQNDLEWQYQYGQGSRGQKFTDLATLRGDYVLAWGPKFDGLPTLSIDGEMHDYVARPNQIQKFYQTGFTNSNTIAFSGGSEKANFRFSIGNVYNDGITPENTYKRNNYALSLSAKPNDKISIEASGQYIREDGNNRPLIGGGFGNVNKAMNFLSNSIDILWMSDPVVDENGNEYPYTQGWGGINNPYFVTQYFKNFDSKNRFILSAATTYNISEDFYAKVKIGEDYTGFDATRIEPTGAVDGPNGRFDNLINTRSEYNLEGILGYKKTFGDFDVNAFVGANRQHNYYKETSSGGSNFIIPYQYFYANTKDNQKTTIFESNTEVNSVYFSGDVGYKNFLFLSLTGRNDWFSTLSTSNNHIFYPSVSSSFVVSEVVKLPEFWSYSKLRAAIGNVGGAAPEPYALSLTYRPIGDGFNGLPITEVEQGTIPNPALKPYNVQTIEFGTENTFFNNRLNLDFTWYSKTTTNDIANASLSTTSGYANTKINVGEISNKGIELQIGGIPIKKENFKWDVNYNLSYNISKVVKVSDELNSQILTNLGGVGGIYLEEGQPFGIIKAYEPLKDAKGNLVLTNDGYMQKGELVHAGDGVAPYRMGLTNDFTYKNWRLSTLIDAQLGGDIFSDTNFLSVRYGLQAMTLQGREGGINVSGVDNAGNPINKNISAFDYWRSSFKDANSNVFVYSSDFVKLRSVSLEYKFDKEKLSKFGIEGLSLALVAHNLWVIYKDTPNIDPESNSNSGNAQGYEQSTLPRTKSVGINLNIKF